MKYRQCKSCTRAWPVGKASGSCICGGKLSRPITKCSNCGSVDMCLPQGRCMYAAGRAS